MSGVLCVWKRMIDDERNRLYKSYVNIVSIIKPKAFVMENVPGLVRHFQRKSCRTG